MSDLSGLQARDSHPIVLLHELCDLCSGITKGRKTNSTETFKAPYMTVANVQDSKLSLDNVKTIDATPEEIERFRLLPGDLLLTEGGDPESWVEVPYGMERLTFVSIKITSLGPGRRQAALICIT